MNQKSFYAIILLSAIFMSGCDHLVLNSEQKAYETQLMSDDILNGDQVFSRSEFDSAWSRGFYFVRSYGFRRPQVIDDSIIETGTPGFFQGGYGYILHAFRTTSSDSIIIVSAIFMGERFIRLFQFTHTDATMNLLILRDYMRTRLLPHPELITR